jgi:hypothetical protein
MTELTPAYRRALCKARTPREAGAIARLHGAARDENPYTWAGWGNEHDAHEWNIGFDAADAIR